VFYSTNQNPSVAISIAKPIPRPDRLLSRDPRLSLEVRSFLYALPHTSIREQVDVHIAAVRSRYFTAATQVATSHDYSPSSMGLFDTHFFDDPPNFILGKRRDTDHFQMRCLFAYLWHSSTSLKSTCRPAA
jgi:hypothetical protein